MYKKDLNFIIDIIKDKSTKHTVNDWYSLLGFIETNKLSGYILNKLKRKKLEIPKLIYSSLYNTYSLQKVRNNVLRKFINKISYELEINNINHAFLKGSILSNCSFDNKTPIYKLGERTSNDIDILINPKDLGKLEKILEKLHFKQGYYDYFKEKVILFDRKEIISRRMNRNETAPWVLKTTNTIVPFIEIDINFSTSNLSNDNKLTDKLLINTVCYKSIDNNYIRTLEKYDFIIHLILHAYKELTNKFQVDRHKDIQLYKFLDLYLLLSKDIDKCKMKLEKSILSLKDNKLKYSLLKLLESTKDKAYSYNDYGYIEDLSKIQEEDIVKYYNSVIDNDLIDVYVVGDVDENVIKNIFREYFKVKTYHKNKFDILVDELENNSKVIEFNEIDDVNQSQLTILCNLHKLTDYERKYVLPIYGELLGGSSNSILFNNVREKNSYAYYVNAVVKPYDNVMMIYSGIEKGTENDVYKLIQRSLKDVMHGKFDVNKLENAKNTMCSAIIASLDSPVGIITGEMAKVLVGAKNPEERIEEFKKISKNDIIAVSKKINIHSKFILEAADEENNN